METLFAVAAVAVIILAVVTLAALWFAIGILRNVRDVSKIAKNQAELLKDDIDRLRAAVKEEGQRFKGIFDVILGLIQRKGRKSKGDNGKK